jgi:SAM-dependent methyltransferase
MAARYRRALMHKHTLMNQSLTQLANWFTDLNLTDLETCYKLVRTPLFQSIPLRSNDFRIEVELAFKLAKRRARIFEAPIRYMPRSYEEGKKIRARDGVLALYAMAHYFLVDDLYQEDEFGSHMLQEIDRARQFNLWLGDTLRPYLGDRILEIGAGIGTLTNQFIPRDRYICSDINPNYLGYLNSYAIGKPYLEVRHIDVTVDEHFEGLEGTCDTAIISNVLEHVSDEHAALANLHRVLEPGGRVVVLVPQHPALYGSLDAALDHRERYTPEHLTASLERAGFRVEAMTDFNRFSVPGWWLNGKLLKKRTFSRLQLKAIDTLMPVLRRLDKALPWQGQSLIAVGVKAG